MEYEFQQKWPDSKWKLSINVDNKNLTPLRLTMPHGWPKKRPRNISRLHGQAAAPHATQIGDESRTVDDSDQHDSESDEHFEDNLAVALDGLKFNFKKVYGDTDNDVSDIDEEIELGILEDKKFGKKLAEMVEREDGKDPEWIPERLWRKKQKQQATSRRKCLTLEKSNIAHLNETSSPENIPKGPRCYEQIRAHLETLQGTVEDPNCSWYVQFHKKNNHCEFIVGHCGSALKWQWCPWWSSPTLPRNSPFTTEGAMSLCALNFVCWDTWTTTRWCQWRAKLSFHYTAVLMRLLPSCMTHGWVM